MNKKVFILSTSMRKGSNSGILADAFAKGATEAGHTVKTVSLENKTISFCKGCLSCQQTHKCIIKDDANSIVDQMLKSDVIVFATPIYFYEMCGQMKTLLDRSNPAFSQSYAFRDIYLIATAADSAKASLNGAIQGLQGWIDCFPQAKLAATLYGVGLTEPDEAKTAGQLLRQAFTMGKAL